MGVTPDGEEQDAAQSSVTANVTKEQFIQIANDATRLLQIVETFDLNPYVGLSNDTIMTLSRILLAMCA